MAKREEYVLEKDECIIIPEMNMVSGSLMLTNKNIVEYRKAGIFSSKYDIITYPVSGIKIYNKKAQAILYHPNGTSPQLHITMTNNILKFTFNKASDVKKWVKEIDSLVVGISKENRNTVAEGAEALGNGIRDTVVGVFSGLKGGFTATPTKTKKIKLKSKTCPQCGAALTGKAGDSVKCEYCGFETII